VQQVVDEGKPGEPTTTIIWCEPGYYVCSFRARLAENFFFPPVLLESGQELAPLNTMIRGSGVVSMEYSVSGGARRSLRTNIHLDGRELQGAGIYSGSDNIEVTNIPVAEQARAAEATTPPQYARIKWWSKMLQRLDKHQQTSDAREPHDQWLRAKNFWLYHSHLVVAVVLVLGRPKMQEG
jgi:hypothetical protein